MKGLVLHPATEEQLRRLQTRPPHAVILSGPEGSGKLALAQQLAADVLALDRPVASYEYIMSLTPAGNRSIGIEAVRELEHFLSLKVPRQADYNRAVIIQDGHLLTHEAQNALLKTLEEPPAGTIVILTVQDEHRLLPTIRSRAQHVAVRPPEMTQLQAHFSDVASDAVSQAYNVSGGLPGLMQALFTQSDHPLVAATEQARNLLQKSTYERLLLADELSKNKEVALQTLFILQQMARLSLRTATGTQAKRWQRILEASYEATEQLAQNMQSKLVLTNFLLHL